MSKANAAKTHCKKGHPYDEANTIRFTSEGSEKRYCRACRKEQRRIDSAREAQRNRDSARVA